MSVSSKFLTDSLFIDATLGMNRANPRIVAKLRIVIQGVGANPGIRIGRRASEQFDEGRSGVVSGRWKTAAFASLVWESVPLPHREAATPGDSMRDEVVAEASAKAGVTLYLTGARHFGH